MLTREAGTPSSHRPWQIRLSAILWFVLIVLFLLALPVLVGWAWWVLAIVLLAAGVLAGAWSLIASLFAARQRQGMARRWLTRTAALTCLLSALVASPVYYFSMLVQTRPAIVPQVTLTNGTKTIVFQGMQHIGSEAYFKGIVYDLERALNDGYVLYYEGISRSPGEGDAWFSKYMAGGGSLNANYQGLAKTCGLTFQLEYFTLLQADMQAHPERHVSADVSHLDLKREFDRLVATDPAFAAAVARLGEQTTSSSDGADTINELVAWQQQGTEGQKRIAGIACRGFMTRMLNNDLAGGDTDALNPVVVDFRNRELAKRALTDTHQKIYITYGAGHLPGFIAELRKADPAWRVVSQRWVAAIAEPQTTQGPLYK